MGVEPPFLYDPPTKQHSSPYGGGFNPKVVSQASLSPTKPRPKQEAPLVNFNKHPDSYLILPYGNTTARPMSPNTKKKIKYTRWIQLGLRLLELLGTLGLLVCVICLKGMQSTVGWVTRIVPGIAILHIVYAIYHLARGPSGRTAASSASYMIFAAILDTALIAGYVLSALLSRMEYVMADGQQGKWGTLFNDTLATDKIILATFLCSVVTGGMHLISLFISIYLAIIFKKISNLPPDMNPLEDNLTSRHKKKNSMASQKHMSQATTISSFSGPTDSKRNSRVDEPLISPPRTIPFMHTRAESTESFSNHRPNPRSNRNSRSDLHNPVYQQIEPKRSSHADSNDENRRSTSTKNSYYTASERPSSFKTSTTTSTRNNNWQVLGTSPEEPQTLARANSNVSSLKDWEIRRANNDYEPLPQIYDDVPNPLFSNPPTPPPQRVLTPASPNRVGTPKARYYGNLKAAHMATMGTYVDLPRQTDSTRVISNSGADIPAAVGRREVSGKVAEEGRSGGWARFRKISLT
ncbi:MAG: hypothetical protein M1812_003994 [Candelaria pacifica]|nr:MAG: hypothetical protein M1812_003994 [Candelaria pacifica]